VEWRGSGTTYDIELVPPMETGRFTSNFVPSWNREVPDTHLFLLGIERFLTTICSFMEFERFLTNWEPSWDREIPDQHGTFKELGGS